jgi:hypothetical protein
VSEEPTQLDIDEELETWEEWFASLPPTQPANDEDEPAATTGPVFLTQRRATAPSPLFPLLKSAEGRSDVTEPGRA